MNDYDTATWCPLLSDACVGEPCMWWIGMGADTCLVRMALTRVAWPHLMELVRDKAYEAYGEEDEEERIRAQLESARVAYLSGAAFFRPRVIGEEG